MKHKHDRMKKVAIIIVVILGAAILAQIVLKLLKSSAPDQDRPIETAAVTVGESIIEEVIRLYGIAEGDPQVQVYPMVHGKFEKPAVTEGDTVTKGQVVLYINRDITGMDFQLAPLRSPIAGTVTRIYYSDRGAAMSPDRPAAEIADPMNVKAVLNTGEAELIKIKRGMKAGIKAAYSEGFVEGSVYSVTPFIDKDTMAGTVIVKAANPDMSVKPGMSVEVKIYSQSRRGIVVPKNALLSGAGRVYVYVNENGIAKEITVQTGYEDEKGVEITSGLKPGQQVITEGNFKLSEGSKINTKL